nr:hypothetical protein [Tanacetum cinerariifolium]
MGLFRTKRTLWFLIKPHAPLGAVYTTKRTLWCLVKACGSGRWPTAAAGGVVAAMAVVSSVGEDEGGVGGVRWSWWWFKDGYAFVWLVMVTMKMVVRWWSWRGDEMVWCDQMASFNRPSFLTGHALADIGPTAPNSIHYAWRYNKMLSFLILQNFVSIRNTYCLLVETITAWLSINQSLQIMTSKLPSPMGIKEMLKGVSKGLRCNLIAWYRILLALIASLIEYLVSRLDGTMLFRNLRKEMNMIFP